MIARNLLSPQEANAAKEEFADDMVDFFANIRGGHIARHGYVGKGGSYYEEWLATNDIYRSRVTQAEIEILTTYAETLGNICGNTRHFVEAGVGSFKAFLMKTHALLARLAFQEPALRYMIADVSKLSFQDVAQQTDKLGLPKPVFHEGNFFNSLPPLEKGSVIYIPGLTITNIPSDAINGDTSQILTETLRFFATSLRRGGTLILSYATEDGISDEGTEIKVYYDDPLIKKYQESIFYRVANELHIEGDYDPSAFQIKHVWWPEKNVLTRHAILNRPLDFKLNGYRFILNPENFSGYMANNFRLSDITVKVAAEAAGFKNCQIFSLQHSNVRVMACSI